MPTFNQFEYMITIHFKHIKVTHSLQIDRCLFSIFTIHKECIHNLKIHNNRKLTVTREAHVAYRLRNLRSPKWLVYQHHQHPPLLNKYILLQMHFANELKCISLIQEMNNLNFRKKLLFFNIKYKYLASLAVSRTLASKPRCWVQILARYTGWPGHYNNVGCSAGWKLALS